MQDRSLASQLHRIERQLNVLILLLGVLVTIGLFTAVDRAEFLLFLLPGMFVVLLFAYVIVAVATPGRPQPESSAVRPEAEGE